MTEVAKELDIEKILFENFQYIPYHQCLEPGVFSANGRWFKIDFTEAKTAISKLLEKQDIKTYKWLSHFDDTELREVISDKLNSLSQSPVEDGWKIDPISKDRYRCPYCTGERTLPGELEPHWHVHHSNRMGDHINPAPESPVGTE